MYKIILEGADGTGKTTLAKRLMERYDLSYVNVNSKDPNDFQFYNQTLKKTKVVYDRHFIGEMIYPKFFQRQSKLNTRQFKKLLKKSKDLNYKIFVLYLPEDKIETNQKDDEFDFIKRNVKTINKKFIKIAKKYNIEMINVFDYTLQEVCDLIEKT